MLRALALMPMLLVSLLASGCTVPQAHAPEPVEVPPPEGGGWASCGSNSAVPMALPLRIEAVQDAQGLPAGIHRLDRDRILWVWASYSETLREDRISRVNEVTAEREHDGAIVLCTRVDLVTPVQVDREPRSYDVAALVTAQEPLPESDLRVVVNWAAGCGCGTVPKGNATAFFPSG